LETKTRSRSTQRLDWSNRITTASKAATRTLIRRYFPPIDAASLELMPHPGWGGDSDAWLVDGRWIFRFPRSTDVAKRLAVEICLLPRLALFLPLPIPRFELIARDEVGQPICVGYPAIPGVPMRPALLQALPVESVKRMAEQLGSFLRALHATPLEQAVACGVMPPAYSPRELVERQLRRVEVTIFPVLSADERVWVEQRFQMTLADPVLLAYAPVLCHGDFTSDHILFDRDGQRLTGIIDFGDLTIGDPVGEFTWRADYGEHFFERVLAVYGPTDRAFAERVMFRINCEPLGQIAYGLEAGRSEDVAEGRQVLRERMRLTGDAADNPSWP
jgi:aminoglycoside 2''-phosphotransferase